MPFEPEEIENKEFLSTLRGYDRDEVRAFLQDVADDYRGVLQLLNQRQKPVATVKDPFDVLGVELGQILKVARESGGQLRKKAEAEASTLMEKVDQEARTIRESADKQARRQREEADRYARDVRSRTDRDAAEKTRRAAETVEQLRRAEAKLRERFASMEGILEALKRELGPEGAAALGPREKAAGAGAGRTGSTPASGRTSESRAGTTGKGRPGPVEDESRNASRSDDRTIRLDEERRAGADRADLEERIFSSVSPERSEEPSGERRRPRFI